jgi:hypothetical protein
MTFIEQKLKHMDLIQDVVKRMASNSFQLKTWTIGIVSAILAMAGKDEQIYLIPLAAVPILLFWGLDAYFLRLERLYRKLYDDVRKREEGMSNIDFSLNFLPYATAENSWFKVAMSRTLIVFYGLLLLVIIALIIAIKIL